LHTTTKAIATLKMACYTAKMPTYTYKCPNDHIYEENRGFDDPQAAETCPDCGEELKRTFSVPIFALKGRGFYSTGG
jgi:putative FmdB family regulatory protein